MTRATAVIAILLLVLSLAVHGTAAEQSAFLAFNDWARGVPPVIWSCLTVFGDTYVALVLLTPCLWLRPAALLEFFLVLPISGLVISGLKRIIESPRPAGLLDPNSFHIIGPLLQNHSYPSGHTFTIFAILAILLLPIQRRAGWLLAWSCGVLLGAGVAMSRLAVGAHWPGDVMAGAGIGWLCGMLAHQCGTQLRQRHTVLDDQRFRNLMALIWLGLSLYLLRVDTAYPMAVPLQWLMATLGGGFSAAYLWRQWRGGRASGY